MKVGPFRSEEKVVMRTPPKQNFTEKLQAKWAKGKFVCVGLDPDLSKSPIPLRGHHTEEQLNGFLHEIVKATGNVVAAFKPNIAFFEKFGPLGIITYESICQYIKHFYPHVIIIGDAKRGDIGNTNIGSAEFLFDRCGVDAVTVSPYLGQEALEPFLKRKDKGVFVLCKTSNPGSDEFQNVEVMLSPEKCDQLDLKHGTQMPMYNYVANRVDKIWNKNGNCGLVTGATFPIEIAKVRVSAPKLPLLIPGIGKQGGDLAASVRNALVDGGGFLINSSRDIIYASSGSDFAKAARAKVKELDQQIRAFIPKEGHPFR